MAVIKQWQIHRVALFISIINIYSIYLWTNYSYKRNNWKIRKETHTQIYNEKTGKYDNIQKQLISRKTDRQEKERKFVIWHKIIL